MSLCHRIIRRWLPALIGHNGNQMSVRRFGLVNLMYQERSHQQQGVTGVCGVSRFVFL